MTYPQAIQYLGSFINYERLLDWPYKESLQLDRFKIFLETIGNPQLSLRCIHVAGSKGKGSTCAFITYILRQAGFKVGLYTSPHLCDFRERIRVLTRGSDSTDFEGMVSKRDLAALVTRIKPVVNVYNKNSKLGPLSFFEVYTAMAFVYFKEKKVDFAVLETGLGGRFDATNTQEAMVSVITPISYEHTDRLGNTLTKIAGEKAGIIKNHRSIVVTAPQGKEAIEVIRGRCKKMGAKLFEVSKDIKITRPRVVSRYGEYNNLKLRLLGNHQWINAATAIGTIEALRTYGVKVGIGAIKKGLHDTLWPGRCEVIAQKPHIVLDGAQNAASSLVLRKAIQKNFKHRKLILILGVSSDKDILGISRNICPLADRIILTRADNPRAAVTDALERVIVDKLTYDKRCITNTKGVKEALGLAKLQAGAKDLILVTGSLFVVGEARQILINRHG